jgi:hypothetical protein
MYMSETKNIKSNTTKAASDAPEDVPAEEIVKGQKTDPTIHKDYDASKNSGGSHSSTQKPEG